MIDFSTVKEMVIPEGGVIKIVANGATLWEQPSSYTNQVPISIGADGKVYNGGLGYKVGYRLSSSGGEKNDNSNSIVTGFIPAKGGDTVRIAGYKWYNTDSSLNYLNAYKSDFGFIYAGNARGTYNSANLIESMTHDDATGISIVKLKNVENMAYIRISLWSDPAPVGTNLIVTVNEEIT